MAGTVVADVFQSSITGTPPQFNDGTSTQIGTLCRAWVNFNGTGTVAIRAAFNVSSITDNGTGDYTVNFTNAMPDVNYSAISNGMNNTNGQTSFALNTTTSSVDIRSGNAAGTLGDCSVIGVAIFR